MAKRTGGRSKISERLTVLGEAISSAAGAPSALRLVIGDAVENNWAKKFKVKKQESIDQDCDNRD